MTTSTSLQAAVFDLDGLMFNTEELYDAVGDMLLRRHGKRFNSELKDQMIGRRGPEALQIMIDWHRLDTTVAELQTQTDEIFARLFATELAPMPGLPELLEALEAAEIPRAIATSSQLTYARQILSQFGYEPRFEFIVCGEDVTHGKPHPEIFQLAVERLAIPARQVMVLEDSGIGCRAAIAAGTFTVAAPGDHSRHHDFAGARLVADSLADDRIYQALGIAAAS